MLLVQKFALILGIVYLGGGVLGFIPPLLTEPDAEAAVAVEGFYGQLIGIFPVN